MFAVAAFALGGMAFAPAFADPFNETDTVILSNVSAGEDQTGGTRYDDACGNNNDAVTDYLKIDVNPPGGDIVRVKYTTSGCTTVSVDIDIYVDSGSGYQWKAGTTRTSATADHLFGGIALDVGDDVKAVVQYTLTH